MARSTSVYRETVRRGELPFSIIPFMTLDGPFEERAVFKAQSLELFGVKRLYLAL
jgi:hypothetical protein